jgi:hypothetical protein
LLQEDGAAAAVISSHANPDDSCHMRFPLLGTFDRKQRCSYHWVVNNAALLVLVAFVLAPPSNSPWLRMPPSLDLLQVIGVLG